MNRVTMPYDLSRVLVIGVSSRALFDLEWEARIYSRLGAQAFREHQLANENDVLNPGTAFSLAKGLLALNPPVGDRAVEVIVISRNDPDIGLRVTKSIEAHGLDISRIAYIGRDAIVPYLEAYKVDLFLSCNDPDVQEAVDAGLAAAALYRPPNAAPAEMKDLRIAFDADAVLFSEESEHIYRTEGLPAFLAHEKENAHRLLAEGPLARLLIRLGALQRARGKDESPVRLAVVTARNSPAHERVIRTLREWGVSIDAAFFLGGVAKTDILRAFGAHIYFDDQEGHLAPAAGEVPCALVPYRSNSVLRRIDGSMAAVPPPPEVGRDPA